MPAILEDGHEVGHHGYIHLRSDKVSPAEQREEIEKGFAALEAAGAPRPRGYRSPAWELTPETFALLVEYGFAYDSQLMGDDRPYVEEHDGLRLLELPVHWSLDDWPRFGWYDRPRRQRRPTRPSCATPGSPSTSRRAPRAATSASPCTPRSSGAPTGSPQLERLVERIVADGDAWFAPLEDVAEHAAAVLPRGWRELDVVPLDPAPPARTAAPVRTRARRREVARDGRPLRAAVRRRRQASRST